MSVILTRIVWKLLIYYKILKRRTVIQFQHLPRTLNFLFWLLFFLFSVWLLSLENHQVAIVKIIIYVNKLIIIEVSLTLLLTILHCIPFFANIVKTDFFPGELFKKVSFKKYIIKILRKYFIALFVDFIWNSKFVRFCWHTNMRTFSHLYIYLYILFLKSKKFNS